MVTTGYARNLTCQTMKSWLEQDFLQAQCPSQRNVLCAVRHKLKYSTTQLKTTARKWNTRPPSCSSWRWKPVLLGTPMLRPSYSCWPNAKPSMHLTGVFPVSG